MNTAQHSTRQPIPTDRDRAQERVRRLARQVIATIPEAAERAREMCDEAHDPATPTFHIWDVLAGVLEDWLVEAGETTPDDIEHLRAVWRATVRRDLARTLVDLFGPESQKWDGELAVGDSVYIVTGDPTIYDEITGRRVPAPGALYYGQRATVSAINTHGDLTVTTEHGIAQCGPEDATRTNA